MVDGDGSGSIAIDSTERKTVVREILDELGDGANFLDGHQLLEDMQGDCTACGSGMFIFGYGEHSVRIVVIDHFGECADRSKVHLSFLR